MSVKYLAIGVLAGLAACQSVPKEGTKTYSDRDNRYIAGQADDLSGRRIGAISDSRQNLRRHKRASMEAEELHTEMEDLTGYRVIEERELERVVTGEDTGNKGEYLSLKPAEGAEIIEIIYGGKKKHFRLSDLEKTGPNVRVYLRSGLGVRHLKDGIGIVFYGEQPIPTEVQPAAPEVEQPVEPTTPDPAEQEHEEVMQRIEEARTESQLTFEQKMRDLAGRILGVNVDFLRTTEEAVAGYAQRRDVGLDEAATRLTTGMVNEYQAEIEKTRDNVNSLFDRAEQAKGSELEAVFRERFEKLRAQKLAPKEN